MPLTIYNKIYQEYFNSGPFKEQYERAVKFLSAKKRIFFIGNGGSNSICSHMMEDYAKIGKYKTFTFSDPALITCFANDYGYENAMMEWCKIYLEKEDVLIAISSSGSSQNILNAADYANSIGASVITLSGFEPSNKLREKGILNFHIPVKNYGIVECFHQVILHAILDKLAEVKNQANQGR